MNTITLVVTIMVLWLVTGLGFLAAYVKDRRKGRSLAESWTSYEGLLFVGSIVVPLILLAIKLAR